MTLIEMRGMTMQYAGTPRAALRGVDLNVRRGERIAILGLSGAGKSTLIRCMNRLVEPTSGTVVWHGDANTAYPNRANDARTPRPAASKPTPPVLEPTPKGSRGVAEADVSDNGADQNGVDVLSLKGAELRAYRRRIGMVFQQFHLIDRLTVLANVLTGRFGYVGPWQAALGRYAPEDMAMAHDALARVGLAGFEGRKARTLSGGQRQRVAIARALVQQPLLLLGDEPVSNLDPVTARGVMRLLMQINERDGLTMIVNLHSVELAKQFARRIIGMKDGRIVFDDSPDKLDDDALHGIYSNEPRYAANAPGT